MWIVVEFVLNGFCYYVVYIMIDQVGEFERSYVEIVYFFYGLVDGSYIGYLFFQYLYGFVVEWMGNMVYNKFGGVFVNYWFFVLVEY